MQLGLMCTSPTILASLMCDFGTACIVSASSLLICRQGGFPRHQSNLALFYTCSFCYHPAVNALLIWGDAGLTIVTVGCTQVEITHYVHTQLG